MNKHIFTKLAVILAISLGCIICCMSVITFITLKNRLNEELADEAARVSIRLTKSLESALWSFDKQSAQAIVAAEMNNKHLGAIDVYIDSSETNLFFSYQRDSLWNVVAAQKSSIHDHDNCINRKNLIVKEGRVIGWVASYTTTRFKRQELRETMLRQLASDVSILIVSLVIILVCVRVIIIRPIHTLIESTRHISEGNYDIPVGVVSTDEIGNLAGHFDSMRLTIRKHTLHLQEMIDARMQQVKDILDNIDQGLFTINLDGTINPEYSRRTNALFSVGDASMHTMQEVLRVDKQQQNAFSQWLRLVRNKSCTQRWEKIVRLSPVQQIDLYHTGNAEPVSIEFEYRKVVDKSNCIGKIMVLARDVTDKRQKERVIQEQWSRHNNQMMTVLGIVNTPPEEMVEFITDVELRLNRLSARLRDHLARVEKMRADYPDGPMFELKSESIEELYRDIHTLKGNAGSFGFEHMSAVAHSMEDELNALRQPVQTRRDETIKELLALLDKQIVAYNDIREKVALFFGEGEALSVKVPLHQIQSIESAVKRVEGSSGKAEVQALIDECRKLTWKQLKDITNKYQRIVQKASRKLGKKVQFLVEPEKLLLQPDLFEKIDEALVHLVRNAVDHGIELPEDRAEAGKAIGRITLSYEACEGEHVVTIADDGAGIDGNLLCDKAIAEGIISKHEMLSNEEKCALIFTPEFSTTKVVTDISGRGYGMDIVKRSLTAIGATISIKTKVGQGTAFTLRIPISPQTELSST